jgi:putative ATPase
MDSTIDVDVVIEGGHVHGHMIIIMDEIHRLNKDKQDLLLPHLENGLISLIGLTTSNPYFSINKAIRSRCHIFELHPLKKEHIKISINRGIEYLNESYKYTEDVIDMIATGANGDLRYALNLVELLSITTNEQLTKEIVKRYMRQVNLSEDKDGDGHYDLLSAFQKSIRGSDVNATMHYLGRLVVSGDLDSIARRMSVIAFEDIGLSDPTVGPLVMSAIDAARQLGFPEARIPLSVAAVQLALSPKSNSAYSALDAAIEDIQKGKAGRVPNHLRDRSYDGAKDLGHGDDYKYPHAFKYSYIKQQYLPDTLKKKVYFEPVLNGQNERNLSKYYEWIKKQSN